MFLLNKNITHCIESLIPYLQYKMFLLNDILTLKNWGKAIFTIQNVPIKYFI